MIGTFIVPAKKHLNFPGKVLATVLVLTISIFQSTTVAAANALILDNDEAGTSSTGRWRYWEKNDPYGGSSFQTSKSGATYTFSVALPTAGEYQVFAWWTERYIRRTGVSKRRTSVPYDINHLDGTSTVTVNQQENSGQWNQLGDIWRFDKTATITIRSLGDGSTSADAIMLVPVGNNTVNGTETQTGSITLNWTAPVTRADSSPIALSEIAGFTIHYGTSVGSYPNMLNVDDGSATSVTIADLQVGTYYLVATTRDNEGRESGYSGEVEKIAN
jgi:hypothetical protein